MEELLDTRERVSKAGVVGNKLGVSLVLLLGSLGHVLASIVGNEDLDSVCNNKGEDTHNIWTGVLQVTYEACWWCWSGEKNRKSEESNCLK